IVAPIGAAPSAASSHLAVADKYRDRIRRCGSATATTAATEATGATTTATTAASAAARQQHGSSDISGPSGPCCRPRRFDHLLSAGAGHASNAGPLLGTVAHQAAQRPDAGDAGPRHYGRKGGDGHPHAAPVEHPR